MTDLECKGCQRSTAANLPDREVTRLTAEYVAAHPGSRLVTHDVYTQRLAACQACADVRFGGTTCRYCGCLVAIRAKLAEKACPASQPRWSAT
jgi:hypothetical protein